MDGKTLVIGGGALAVLLGGLTWWFMNNWEKLIHATTQWCRERGHTGMLKFIVFVEQIGTGVYRAITKFVGRVGTSVQSETQSACRTLNSLSELPVEFQSLGTHQLQMEV